MRLLVEKSVEYNLDIIYLTFIDFQKSFDTAEHWSIFKALKMSELTTGIYNCWNPFTRMQVQD